jgi:hypothetical protein
MGEQDLEEALEAVAARLREELALAAGAVDVVQWGGSRHTTRHHIIC